MRLHDTLAGFRVNPNNFFTLGGASLAAMRVYGSAHFINPGEYALVGFVTVADLLYHTYTRIANTANIIAFFLLIAFTCYSVTRKSEGFLERITETPIL